MSTSNYLDMESWNRRNQFQFFIGFDSPFFNICAEVDVTALLAFARERQVSFFLASLFFSTKAANAIDEFHYRIRGERVLIHDVVHAGSTILNADDTFGFCYFDFQQDFEGFEKAAIQSLERYHNAPLTFDAQDERDDLIHYSVIPWVSFKSFAHARMHRKRDSIPKIVFGKYYESGGKVQLPVSVEVHHALMDGLHVGMFYETFQRYVADPLNGIILNC